MEGALNEMLLEKALLLHEELIQALDKERAAAASALGAQGEGAGQAAGLTDDLIDFGEDSKPPAPAEAAKPIAVHAGAGGPDAAAAAAAAAAATATAAPQALSDDAIFGSPLTQQSPAAPASDGAVLAEADQLLQQLGLDQKAEQQGEGKATG